MTWKTPKEIQQFQASDLVRHGGKRWRVTREGYPDREFDDWDEAESWFRGDLHLLVARTIQAID